MDICNLGKTKVILDILWLAIYNPEIDCEKEKVKMIQYSPIYRKKKQEIQKKKQVRKIEKGKTVEELAPRRFWKWKQVFGKKELERMSIRKP